MFINSVMFRAAFAIVGPAVGFGIDGLGEHMVLAIAGALFLPASLGALRWVPARSTKPAATASVA